METKRCPLCGQEVDLFASFDILEAPKYPFRGCPPVNREDIFYIKIPRVEIVEHDCKGWSTNEVH